VRGRHLDDSGGIDSVGLPRYVLAMERLMRPFAALTRWALALCALLIVLVAVYASLGRALIPLVAEYRNLIEAKAHQALGVPVRIGALEGQWQGLAPVLTLRDVQVGEGEQALHLDQARVVPGLWASLMAREPRLSRLQLQGMYLGLREDANGRWSADGLPSQEEAPSDPGQILQRLRQLGRVDVLDSQLVLRPWQHDPMTLSYVNVGLQAGAPNQRLDVQANLPDGHPLSLSLRAQVDPDAWRDGSFEAYMQLPQADWARWLPSRLLGDWRADTLQVGGQAWVDWRQGRLHGATVKLAAPRLKGAHARQAPVTVQDMAVAAWVDRRDEGLRLTVDALSATVGQTPLSSRLLVRQQTGPQPAAHALDRCPGAVAGGRQDGGRRLAGDRHPAQREAAGSTQGRGRPAPELRRQPRAGRLRCLSWRSSGGQCQRQRAGRPGAGRTAARQRRLHAAPGPDLRQTVALPEGQRAPDLAARRAALHPGSAVHQGTG
jgi:hypothetical protein